MFPFFKITRKPRVFSKKSIIQRKAFTFLSGHIQKVQRKAADFLSRQEQKLSYRQKKIALIFFFSGMLTLSLYPLYSAFIQNNHQKPSYLKFRSTRQPISTALPDSLDIQYLKFLKARYEFEEKLKDSLHSNHH